MSNHEALADPAHFILESIHAGLESDDLQYGNWSEGIMRQLGDYLLVMVEYQGSLPDQLRQAYPEALKNYFQTLPKWMRYDGSGMLRRDLEILPAETLDVILPHMHSRSSYQSTAEATQVTG